MKKLSESVYRSPKWLQKFADFEFRTGEDIKGEPSEKQKEKIRKQEEEERKEKEKRDREIRVEREQRERKRRREEAEQRKKDDQQKIERELQNIFDSLVRDFRNNPYRDKYDTPRVGGGIKFEYRFENGWKFEMVGNQITYIDDKYRHSYTIGLIWRNKFVQLANEIINKGKSRPTNSDSGKSNQNYKKNDYKKSEPYKETPKTGNPQRDRYNLLNDKIKIREEQLNKMSKNDPDRISLQNELDTYKRLRDRIKDSNKFENLKTFGMFFNESKSKSWQEKFNDIYNFYLKNKDKENISVLYIPSVDLKENDFSISQTLDNHLVFYGQTGFKHNLEVVDFSEADIYDTKSTRGVYKITPQDYDKYRKKAQEISDWLDDRSEREFGKSSSSISNTGDLNLEIDESEIALLDFSEKVKSELELPKSLEFEISYRLWTSNSTNELVNERFNFVINDLKFDYGGDRLWCELFTKDPFGNDAYMWIESDTSHEYFDFENHNKPYDMDKLIKIDLVKKEMTRKGERENSKNSKFPYALWYEATPCKWESIEFIKSITSILKEMNLSLKNK